ncbi:MAG: hypothetical protein HY723_00910 [Chloroflexi bacterium]|nr:hypothetical protein [Chloroflexota bacterium]
MALRLAATAALAAGAMILITAQAAAQGPTAAVGDAAAAPGETVTVELGASDIVAPGLAAWSIDISYDPSVVEVLSCDPVADTGSQVCNPDFTDDSMRLAGASANGLEGDSALAELTFKCIAAGTSAIEVDLVTFADATLGAPAPIDAEVDNGEITCAGAAGLPDSGQGADRESGASLFWLVATLSIAGLALLGFGFRTRRRA